jgi:protein O-GlcNAc transferase
MPTVAGEDVLGLLEGALRDHRAGRLQAAEAVYLELTRAVPPLSDAWHLLGLVRWQSGRSSRMEFARAISIRPDAAVYLSNFGIDLGVRWQRRALAIDPNLVDAHDRAARAHFLAGEIDDSHRHYRRSLSLMPSRNASWRGLTETLSRAARDPGRSRGCDAEKAAARAVAIEPLSAQALFLLATHARPGVAPRLYRRLLAISPDVSAARANFANRLQQQGRVELAATHLRRALASWPVEAREDPRYAYLHSNLLLCLAYDPTLTNEAMFAEHRQWDRLQAASGRLAQQNHDNDPDPDRSLRVGYLSADLREHTVAYFIEDLIAGHDPLRVEVACYAEVANPDATTARFRSYSKVWRSTVGSPDAQVASWIRQDRVDILVVPAGHIGGTRLRVCSLRPAPVQINLHNLTTSGLTTMDWWMTDHDLCPPGTTELSTEKLLYVPSVYVHRPPVHAHRPRPKLAATNGTAIFASFSNPAKLNDRVIQTWSRILGALQGARLLLGYLSDYADEEACRRLMARFAAFGTEPHRIVFLDLVPDRAAHLARYDVVDVALDPFPFSGCTSTFEALWMGVPVVTLCGIRSLSRMSTALLRRCGADDLVATNEDEYVEIATTLAADGARLASYRLELRNRLMASPLCRPESYVRSIEDAYRRAWHEWCARRKSGDRGSSGLR